MAFPTKKFENFEKSVMEPENAFDNLSFHYIFEAKTKEFELQKTKMDNI